MAEDKKSFLLYADIIHTVKKLPKEKAGELFVTILSYVNDENPVVEDMVIDLVFEPIKQQLKRDLKRWEEFRKKQSERGSKGGRPKKEENPDKPEKATAFFKNPENPTLISESLNANANANANVTVKASSGNLEVFEIMRRQLLPTQFSDNYIRDEAVKFVKKYSGQNIKNAAALVSTWVSNMQPDIHPKRFVN